MTLFYQNQETITQSILSFDGNTLVMKAYLKEKLFNLSYFFVEQNKETKQTILTIPNPANYV
jgi:hypothetical protein